jgi:tetratricopeptide (TPR) repeat protein
MLLAALLSASRAGAQEEELVRLYSEARAAEAAGDYPAATQRYERIVAIRPDMAEAHANLGNLYYVQNRPDRAEASFNKALRLKPSLAAPQLLLGVIHFNRGELDQAVSKLGAALKLEPANAMAQVYLGYSYYASARYPEAAELLEKAAGRDGGNADAWYHLSMVYGQLSRHYLERLQKQFAGAFETHLVRSHFQESSGNWVEARNELTLALARQPDSPAVRQRIEWLTRRAAGETPEPPAGSEQGSTRYLHNPPAGADILTAAAEERSQVADALQALPASTRQSLYRLAEGYRALSFLSSLWVLHTGPDSYRAHQLRAQSLEAAGRLDEAVAEYREVLTRKPDLRTIHFAIGNIY